MLLVAPLTVTGLASCTPPDGQPLEAAGAGEHHKDHGFPIGPTCEMPVFDPRWSTDKLFYSLIGDHLVMVEGDLILGTEEEVLRQSWSNAVRVAKEAVAREAVLKALPSEQARNAVRRLANAAPGDLRDVGRAKLFQEVEQAVQALRPLQDLWPSGPPERDVERQAVAIFAGASRQFRWDKGLIPYEDAGVDHPNALANALAHWETRTDKVIRFVKRDPGNAAAYPDYVRFEKGLVDCYAYAVGRRPGLGAHRVTLADDCAEPQIIHEIGHIVGLFHEHCRTDRDKWIELDPANLKKYAKEQFGKISWKEEKILTPFDFRSIMLYPYKAFAEDPQGAPTIKIRPNPPVPPGATDFLPKDPSEFGLATGPSGGKTVGLSDLDVQGVKKMYLEKPVAPGGG
jgi:hypothetical protein